MILTKTSQNFKNKRNQMRGRKVHISCKREMLIFAGFSPNWSHLEQLLWEEFQEGRIANLEVLSLPSQLIQ
jgi:hypothetical protein